MHSRVTHGLLALTAAALPLGAQTFSPAYNTTLAVDSAGNVWQFGVPPAIVPGIGKAFAVAAGRFHYLAVELNGTVLAWGSNSSGELGLGDYQSRTTPTRIAGLGSVVKVFTTDDASFALDSSGQLWSWGNNIDGQLGIGSTTTRFNTPQKVNLPQVTAVAAGRAHVMAIDNTGQLWGWGYNSWGQLGLGNNRSQTSPNKVASMPNVAHVSAGRHTLVIDNAAQLWCCGYNANSQLGGLVGIVTSFTRFPNTNLVRDAAAGRNHTLVLDTNSTLWSCGYNVSGQLGLGTTTQANVLTRVSLSFLPTSVLCGGFHSFAFDIRGATRNTYACGMNSTGQLGLGHALQTLTFDAVPAALLTFGTGCAGSSTAGPPILTGTAPSPGRSMNLDASNLPANAIGGQAILGLRRLPTPVDLGALGAPGCLLRISDNLWGPTIPALGGKVSWTVQVPGSVAPWSPSVYVQFGVFAPGVNPLGVVTTNSAELRLGPVF
ncbi:MAG: hypothetical protein H6836_06530 [Planctomycetes bacterium]|nr:hypothetical protein [Planctomycetota bacterium]